MNEGRDILDVYKKIDENIPGQYQELKNALHLFTFQTPIIYNKIDLNIL
jgi:hypothetical protein